MTKLDIIVDNENSVNFHFKKYFHQLVIIKIYLTLRKNPSNVFLQTTLEAFS